MRRLAKFLGLAAVLALGAAPAFATYDAPPFGHHDVREIVIVDHTGDARITAGAQHGADLWNAAGANFHFTVIPGEVSTAYEVCYDYRTAGRIHLCMDPDNLYMGGFTTYDYEPGSTTHIRAAYVRICGGGLPFCYDYNDPSTVRRIVPHELGHSLGLYHQSNPSRGDTCSIMSTTCYSEVLSNEDRATLIQLYGHSDGFPSPTTTTSSTSTTVATTITTTTTLPTPTTTTTVVPTTTTTSTSQSLICVALANQYAAYAGNPAAQAAIRQAQISHGCSV